MKRLLVLTLCLVLFHSILAADAFALAPAPAPSRHAKKVADAVAHLGVGDDALVAIRLQDRSVVKGRIVSVAAESFVVSDVNSTVEQRVYYSAVARLEGVNLSNGRQVQVGGGLKARIARAALLVLPTHRVQKNSLTSGEKTLLIGIVVGVLLAIILAKAL